MTDKEIIQALECCRDKIFKGCDNCPMDEDNDCIEIVCANAVDLINRQQAEIEGLQKTLENRKEADRIALEAYEQLLYENDYQQAEIEKMKVRIDAFDKAFDEVFPPEMIEKAKEMVGADNG